ncbi:MAG: hypothetical protein ABL958_18805, partial [Bdellovibrionia bacterium]
GTALDWRVPGDLPYLKGHFPNQAVLPGVAILDATVSALKLISGRDLRLGTVRNAKFLQLVRPGMKARLEFKHMEEERWKIQWFSQSDDGIRVLLVELDLDARAR